MEPLTALSLAAGIAQFLEFGSKLIKETKEVAEAGSTRSLEHLSTITPDLIRINSSLGSQLKPKTSALSEEEQALLDLVDKCNEVCDELTGSLDQLTLSNPKGKTRKDIRILSARIAFRTIWSKSRIEGLAQRLDDYRNQLTLRVLLLLNKYHALQAGKLDESRKEIIEVVSLNCDSLKSVIEDSYRRNRSRHRHEYAQANERHAQAIAAILTTRDGSSKTIQGLPCGTESSRSGPAVLSTATTYRQAVEENGQSTVTSANFETNDFTAVTKVILDSLHFRRINERHAAISEAHESTFEWIYRGRLSGKTKCDSISRWLKGGTGCYWIGGKAGSGKSTLMKYIQGHVETGEALREWSGSSDLVVASFFFWYAGTSLQTSQAGLLRSLLLKVLTRRPDLVAMLFPDICRSLLSRQLKDVKDISFNELKSAFVTLLHSIPEDLKICFIIDGVDEYKGDHHEISELFSQVAESHSVKLLVSSRPLPAFVQAFSNFPKLRLQDLTHDDIMIYVKDKLGADALMQRLDSAHSGTALQLMNNITSKASGVFLWVILVVRSLLSGLRDYDTIPDLQQKLDELPPDLEALYEHMLGDMSPQNRRQGSKLLQLVLRSLETHGKHPLTLLQLSFAEDEEYSDSFETRQSALSDQQLTWRYEATEGRIRSRCCGLIEVQGPLNSPKTTVGPFHRTVVEFLRLPEIWEKLTSLTSETKFNVDLALLGSALAETNLQSMWPGQREADAPLSSSILRFMSYERHMQKTLDLLHHTYLPILTQKKAHSWYEKPFLYTATTRIAETQPKGITGTKNLPWSRIESQQCGSFFLFAACQCPPKHLWDLLKQNWSFESRSPSLHLSLDLLIQFHEDDMRVPMQNPVYGHVMACAGRGLRALIAPSDLKQDWRDHLGKTKASMATDKCTFWEFALYYTYFLTQCDEEKVVLEELLSLLDLLISLLEDGAKIATIIVREVKCSSFTVLRSFLRRLWIIEWDVQTSRNQPCDAKKMLDAIAIKALRLETVAGLSDLADDEIEDRPEPSDATKIQCPRLDTERKRRNPEDTDRDYKKPRVRDFDASIPLNT